MVSIVRLARSMIKPDIDSQWKHEKGAIYTVYDFSNEKTTQPERYPVMIHYKDVNGDKWSRPLSDWHRSMVELKISYVNTIIFNEDLTELVYLQKLTGPKFLLNRYNFIGGKVDNGETPLKAAVREVKEEAFLELDENDLVSIATLDGEDWRLETFTVKVSNHLFKQSKQTGIEPVFIGRIDYVWEDAVANPHNYSNDFMYFLERAKKHFNI
jgi:8-oxo-dGTP pyrophosphatase MutT (NUDIX family)